MTLEVDTSQQCSAINSDTSRISVPPKHIACQLHGVSALQIGVVPRIVRAHSQKILNQEPLIWDVRQQQQTQLCLTCPGSSRIAVTGSHLPLSLSLTSPWVRLGNIVLPTPLVTVPFLQANKLRKLMKSRALASVQSRCI